ncbi:MAG: NCS2 family permease [Clostridia bacterium]|nr:NCS2 family permease [Clostridia bacterium]
MNKFFKIKERGSSVKTEIVAGLTTFFAMAYIIVLGPNQITGTTGGPFWNAVYIATVFGAILGTLYYAFYANLPYAQACGIGLNAFFFASFVNMDKGITGYQAGLVIVFLSGVIFLVLSLTGAREVIAKSMPDCIKKAIPVGIGLFIAFIGFQNVGIIQDNPGTLVQFVQINGAEWKDIAPAIVALIGFFIIVILSQLNVKGAVLIGVVATSVIYYVATWQLPSFEGGSLTGSFSEFFEISFLAMFKPESWKNAFSEEIVGGVFGAILLIISFSIVNMFDTIGTLYGTASEAGMLDEHGDPIDMNKAMTCDSTATITGAMCGTSTCTTFVESASGVAAGGRTGLSSVVTAICFALCLFLTPIASIIPAAATAPALIYVGVLMFRNVTSIDMTELRSKAAAFLTIIMMPLTYSIANGIGIGAIAYVIITLCSGKFKKNDIAVTIVALLFLFKFIFGGI